MQQLHALEECRCVGWGTDNMGKDLLLWRLPRGLCEASTPHHRLDEKQPWSEPAGLFFMLLQAVRVKP